jgi:large subunit ribosomal protein L9
MQVILIQDVDNLGGINELVKVKNGYARNFLIPQKKAVEANASNLKRWKKSRSSLQKKKQNSFLKLTA